LESAWLVRSLLPSRGSSGEELFGNSQKRRSGVNFYEETEVREGGFPARGEVEGRDEEKSVWLGGRRPSLSPRPPPPLERMEPKLREGKVEEGEKVVATHELKSTQMSYQLCLSDVQLSWSDVRR